MRGDEAIAPRFSSRRAFDRFVAEGRSSPFGVDYVFVHNAAARDTRLVDEICGKMPVRWVNLTKLEWKVIERWPPRNGKHRYNWSDLDGAVRAWQRNGVHIMLSLRFHSPWATAPRTDKEFVYLGGLARALALRTADYLPRPERMQDLREYARNLVERYDGDGTDDMPGLLYPVLHYQVGNEYYNEVYWTGTADEYGVLLRAFRKGARAASSKVKIILSGIGFEKIHGYYDRQMAPRTRTYVDRHLPRVKPRMRRFLARSVRFSRKTVAFHDAYDILDARWPNHGIVARSRELLKETGRPEKEVWSAEIYCGFPLMEALVLPNWTLQAWPTPSRSQEYIRVLKNPKHRNFEEINRWYRGLQAAQVVKICMAALSAGSRRLMMGWAVDVQNPLAPSTLSHHGLYSATFKKLWPAGHTYALTLRKLRQVTSVRRVSTAGKNVYLYRCLRKDGREVLVAFFDDHIGQNHDQPTGETTATIAVGAGRARVTQIIRRIGQSRAKTVERKTAAGQLRLRLTEYPVFVEPIGD